MSTDREQLIEEAANAAREVMARQGVYTHRQERGRTIDEVIADVVLAVFEKAHTPTDDEWADDESEPEQTCAACGRDDVLTESLPYDDNGVGGVVCWGCAAVGVVRRTVQGDYYDDGTLVKVYDALQSVFPDLSDWLIRDQVSAMQNAGILFRERRTVQGEPTHDEREAIMNALLDELGWDWDEVPEEHIPSTREILGDMADRVLAVADRFRPPTPSELSEALEAMTAEKEKWRKRCAEETIAWADEAAESQRLRSAARTVQGEPTERSTEFEAMEVGLYKHQPVLSIEDGSIAGCQCMDRVFYRDSGEDWGTHLAELVETEISNRAGVASVQGEPEWEYRYAEVHDDGSTYTYGPKGNPDWSFPTIEAARAEAVEDSDIIVRRTKAGPWVAVQAPEGEEADRG